MQFATVEALGRLTSAVQEVKGQQSALAVAHEAVAKKVDWIYGTIVGAVTEDGEPRPGILLVVSQYRRGITGVIALHGAIYVSVATLAVESALHMGPH